MAVGQNTSIMLNKQAVLLVTGLSCLFLYCFYNYLPSIATKYHAHEQKSWKSRKHKALPLELENLKAQVNIKERHMEIFDGTDKLQVFYREALPVNNDVGLPVLFLHGASDDSKKWQDLGTLHLVAAMGHRVIAIDLPGWGKTKNLPKQITPQHFMTVLLKKMDFERPVIVAPSMAGRYALPYLMEPTASMCHERARGFVAVACTSTDKYSHAQYHRCPVPTMIVFGINDTNLGLSMVGDLRNLANNEIEPVPKAGHAVMFDKPKEWHLLLYTYLQNIVKTPSYME